MKEKKERKEGEKEGAHKQRKKREKICLREYKRKIELILFSS